MSIHTKAWRRLAVLAAMAGLLAACGGGGGDNDVAGRVPESALRSVAAFVAFVGSLTADDTGEPLLLDSAQPPQSDTEEPID